MEYNQAGRRETLGKSQSPSLPIYKVGGQKCQVSKACACIVYKKVRGRSRKNGPTHGASVCGPEAIDNQHCQHQKWKQCKCTYANILNQRNELWLQKLSHVWVLFCFVSFLSKSPSNYCGTQSAALLTLQPCCFAHVARDALTQWEQFTHTVRWRHVALLIRGLHLYSQPWSHLKACATAKLCHNVLFSLFSAIPIHGGVFEHILRLGFLSAFLYVNTYSFRGRWGFALLLPTLPWQTLKGFLPELVSLQYSLQYNL